MLTLININFIDRSKQTLDFNIKQIIIVRDLNIKAKLLVELENTSFWFLSFFRVAIERKIYYDARTNENSVDCVDRSEKMVLRLINQSYYSQLHIFIFIIILRTY